MIGLGTAINVGLIIAGSLCGLAFGRFMKENLKQTLMIVSGIIVMVMVSSMGKGALFSFIPVGITQWLITAMAHIAAPLMTPSAIDNLSYVGSILIFCVGIDLIWPGKVRIANLLPAIFVAMGLTFLL